MATNRTREIESARLTALPTLPAPGAAATKTAVGRGTPQATVSVAFALLLLALATTSQGAFAIGRWAPLALFVLALLFGTLLVARDRVLERSRAVWVALGGIWGLAGWSLLSMVWAQSSGDAFQAAGEMVLYAAIVTLPFVLPLSRRSLAAAGWSSMIAIGAIALYVLVRLLVDGSPLYLAGRLNSPIDYRNATALLFAMPVWPFIIAAASRRFRRVVRAGALALSVLCLGLVFLTQSRGIVLGLAAGGVLVIAAGPERVRRAWVAILSLAAVAAASGWLLRPYHQFTHGGSVSGHEIAVAAVALTLATVAAFAAGMLVALFDNGLRAGSPAMRRLRGGARLGLAAGVIVAVLAALYAIGNPVSYAQQKWDQFRDLNASTTTGSTRLLTVGGQRYDLWRVALDEFEGAPVLGVGAGNYSFDYYTDRATNRNLDDPHSLVFALLSEQGAVGIVLFCVFLGGIAAAIGGGWRRLTPAERGNAVAPAAAGVVMLGQSAVDWIWLIPGLTAVGLLALSLAAAQVSGGGQPNGRRAQADAPGIVRRRGARIAALTGLVAAAAGVLALFLSDAYVQRARSVVADPSAELSAARVAAALDPWSVTPHYLQASAYESSGDRASAYRQLRDALALEPKNSANWTVLGDFEVRGHDLAAARADYRRALALNPLDTGLRQLARIGEPSPARSTRGA